MKIYYVPETNLSSLQVLTHFILTIPWGGHYYYPHFTEEETEAQKG